MVVIAAVVVTVSRDRFEPAAGSEPTAAAPGQVPPYHVAITSHGNPNFNPSYAVVRATAGWASSGATRSPRSPCR